MVAVVDSATLPKVVSEIIAAYPQVVEDYKNGKEAAIEFLVGQGMKQTKGSANPAELREAILSLLK
jgi:aspartyl-tRNA(Asn)/glutamyl-tRNA(Gln) amidotransferase subunit B